MSSPVQHPPLHLEVRAGQALPIELPALPGAGLMWQAPAAPAGCTLTEADAQATGAGVGGGSRQRFLLTCAKAGQHQLRFDYKRPWEDTVRAVQPVTVTVR